MHTLKILKEITDEDFHITTPVCTQYTLRKAARAILVHNNKIAILYASKLGIYKIPGGGIEENEDIEIALTREILEETGCDSNIANELGMIIERRNEHQFKQISYGYIATVTKIGTPNFTEKEISEGFELLWITIDEALEKAISVEPTEYRLKFMSYRDCLFIQAAKEHLAR